MKTRELGREHRVSKSVLKGPIPEVYYDWLTVQGFVDKVEVDILHEPKADERRLSRYATCQAYLNLARLERNPGQAWNFVNSADKLLPLLVKPEHLRRSLTRQENWDPKLGRLGEDVKRELAELKKKYPVDLEGDKPVTDKMIDNAYCLQASRAQLWYGAATGILALRFTMFGWYTYILFASGLLTVAAAELLFQWSVPSNPLWFRPFIIVSIMGIFGGGLSVRLYAGEYIKRTISLQLIKVMIYTRVLIGAAGALTFYILFASGINLSKIGELTPDNVLYLLAIGITAGFSEQLFVKSLEASAENLSIFGKPNIGMGTASISGIPGAPEGPSEPQ